MATNSKDSKFQVVRIGHIAPGIFADLWESFANTLDSLITKNGYEPGAMWKLGDAPDKEKYPPKSTERNEFFKTHPTTYLAFIDSQYYEGGQPDGYQDMLLACYTVQTNGLECRNALEARKNGGDAKIPEAEFAPKLFIHIRGKRVNGKFLTEFEFNANTSEDGPVWKKIPRKFKESQEFRNAIIALYPDDEMADLKQPDSADPAFILEAALKNGMKFRTARLREDLNFEDVPEE